MHKALTNTSKFSLDNCFLIPPYLKSINTQHHVLNRFQTIIILNRVIGLFIFSQTIIIIIRSGNLNTKYIYFNSRVLFRFSRISKV